MYYGLEMSEVRYETDHAGNKLRATVPYAMFSALIEFWREARRAQTASLETRTRPGQYKGSLSAAASPETPGETPPAPPSSPPSRWDRLLQSMPPSPVTVSLPEVLPMPLVSPIASATEVSNSSDYPKAVLAHIIGGKSPVTAWRIYRDLTIADLANAYGCTPDNIKQIERSTTLRSRTGEKLATIFHCRVEQLARPADIPVSDIPLRVSKHAAQPEAVLQRARRAEARSA